jgi:hypothetical protein
MQTPNKKPKKIRSMVEVICRTKLWRGWGVGGQNRKKKKKTKEKQKRSVET